MSRSLGVECSKCEWSYHEETEPGTAAQVATRVSAAWKAHKAECGGRVLTPRHPFYVTQDGVTEVYDGTQRRGEVRAQSPTDVPRVTRRAQDGRKARTTADMIQEAQEALQEEMASRGLGT